MVFRHHDHEYGGQGGQGRAGARSAPLGGVGGQGRGGPQVLDSTEMLARWLGQVNADRAGYSIVNLARRPEFGKVEWEMRQLGWEQRQQALRHLSGWSVTPDPLQQSVAFSSRQILLAAYQKLGMRTIPFSVGSGIDALRESLSARRGFDIYAFVITHPNLQPPSLYYAMESGDYMRMIDGRWRRYRMATIHAAECLAQLIRDWGLYTGYSACEGFILPVDGANEPAPTVPIHSFAKAFLAMGTECDPHSRCACNLALASNVYVPPHASDNTDILPPLEQYLPSPGSRPSDPIMPSARPQPPIRSRPYGAPPPAAGTPRTTRPVVPPRNLPPLGAQDTPARDDDDVPWDEEGG